MGSPPVGWIFFSSCIGCEESAADTRNRIGRRYLIGSKANVFYFAGVIDVT